MYSFFTDIATVKRKVVDTATSHSEETLVGEVKGYLKAMSIQEVNQSNGVFGKDFNFTCRGDEDIKAGDKVTIGDTTYSVKAVGPKRSINLSILVCKLTTVNTIAS